MADEPLAHIARPSPPWATLELTECGKPAGDVASVKSCAEVVAKVKRDGQQRAAYTTCMTCWNTARRYAVGSQPSTWENDPIGTMERWLQGCGRWSSARERRADAEQTLRALGMLWAEHGDEAQQLLESLEATASLADAREARQRASHPSARRR